ncbi:MAG: FAD-binding protein [Desulfarculaceae bacterium]|nr:FAD-binding protein [Desulfarculaceae bacterium]MCF8073135.1 FAD-binding protein [Desulfarculaceae bacterium]MCF8101780.1 FAD-binding protein [Desulfarculaceae bacterium]MCF8117344.1 FAD-binding protein [Desulfarculaceae bacterium]
MKSNYIWVCGDLRTKRLWRNSLKVLAKALPLAQEAGAPVAMVLMGAPDPDGLQNQDMDLAECVPMSQAAQQAAAGGAHEVFCLAHSRLAVPRSDIFARVLADFVQARKPWVVLFSLNDFGREVAAFGAQRCQAGLIADCEELFLKDGQVAGRCPAWGGEILADITLAPGWPLAFATVRPQGAPEPAQSEPKEGAPIGWIEPERVEPCQGLQLKRRTREPQQTRRLEDAETVVVGGAGLGDLRGFGRVRDLAAALGAEVGATRPPVLHHWVEEGRLIGQTGKTVRPKLLITVGTSGAMQYTAGIMEADTIVAINRDAAAPIFNLADIGIVADAETFLPALTQKAKQVVLRRLADSAGSIGGEEGMSPSGFGAIVGQLRAARNWTQSELAEKTGQDPDFIAQVEDERLSPPVGFILSMAKVMEVDPGTFLNSEEQAAITDRRAKAYRQRTQSYHYTTLTPEAENSHLRAFMITIEPHLAHKPVAYKHEGEEFIFVMEGELEFTLGSKVHQLKAGESIHFNSDIPHKLKSQSSEPTRCLVVLYTL